MTDTRIERVKPALAYRVGSQTLVFLDFSDPNEMRAFLGAEREARCEIAEWLIETWKPGNEFRPDGTLGALIVVEDHPFFRAMTEKSWVAFPALHKMLPGELDETTPNLPEEIRSAMLAAIE